VNQNQRAARLRRDSADFWPATRAAARFSGDVTPHRAHTYDAGLTTIIGHRFSAQEPQTTSQVRGRRWIEHLQVGEFGSGAPVNTPLPGPLASTWWYPVMW
jgi:hypothetical protein